MFDREVTVGGLFAQGLEHDGVDIAGELVRKPLRRARASLGQSRRLDAPRWPIQSPPGGGAGRRRIIVEDHVHQCFRGYAGLVVRRVPGEQLIQQHAERVDIATGGDGFSANLFRTAIAQGHGNDAFTGDLEPGGIGIQHLGDAEVQQLRFAIQGDEDVPRFQIAVHYKVLVRVMHRRADFPEQRQSLFDGELLLIGEAVERGAFNMIHHEVRDTTFGGASVEELHNVWVVQSGERLPLEAEPDPHLLVFERAWGDLNRHLLVELFIGAHAQPHRPHAAFPDLRDDAIGAQHRAGSGGRTHPSVYVPSVHTI